MIIIPSEGISKYVSVDENGRWLHDPDIPKELECEFVEFVKEAEEAENYINSLTL